MGLSSREDSSSLCSPLIPIGSHLGKTGSTSSRGRLDGTGAHDESREAGCAGEEVLSGVGTIEGARDSARDSAADETGDGTSECTRDDATDEALEEAWGKGEDDDTDVACDMDRWEFLVKAYWVSRDWPFIARLCLGRLCDRADFALTSGPNEGTFLFPGHHGKYFMIYALMWD